MKSNLQRTHWLVLATLASGIICTAVYAVPGDTPACVTVDGAATYSNSSTLKFDIGGETACTQHDQLTFGDLTLQGGVLQIRLITGYVPVGGEVFDLLNWGTLTGTFAEPFDFSQAVLAEGLAWDTSQLYITGEISISGGAAVEQVPVPKWLLGLMTTVLLGAGWRRMATIRVERQ